jgi:hypothetical protein
VVHTQSKDAGGCETKGAKQRDVTPDVTRLGRTSTVIVWRRSITNLDDLDPMLSPSQLGFDDNKTCPDDHRQVEGKKRE